MFQNQGCFYIYFLYLFCKVHPRNSLLFVSWLVSPVPFTWSSRSHNPSLEVFLQTSVCFNVLSCILSLSVFVWRGSAKETTQWLHNTWLCHHQSDVYLFSALFHSQLVYQNLLQRSGLLFWLERAFIWIFPDGKRFFQYFRQGMNAH